MSGPGNQGGYEDRPGDMNKAEFLEKLKREREYAQRQADEAAYESSEEGQAKAWWDNFKERLEAGGVTLHSDLGRSRIGYYEYNAQTETMDRKLLSGYSAPNPNAHDYEDSDVLEGSFEPSADQMIKLKKAMDEGRLFVFRPSKMAGDKAFRMSQETNGDLKWEDFDEIATHRDAPMEEPKKPKGVSFMDRVKSFFGNKAAREKVDNYNNDFAKYKADKALWDNSLKNCKTPEEVTKQINANRLAKDKQLRKDTKVVCETYRRNDQAINGYEPMPEEPQENPLETTLSKIHAKYKDFDAKNVNNISQLKDIYRDTYILTSAIVDSSFRNTNLGMMYEKEATGLFNIINTNHDAFKAIEGKDESKAELNDVLKYKDKIGKDVLSIKQSIPVKKVKIKNNDNIVKNDVINKDEEPKLGENNKGPQMGMGGGF